MDDYNNSGVYIGSKDNLINGSRWYNDGENSQGHLRCFNVMMERDKIDRLLLGPTKKGKGLGCLTVKERRGKCTITCMHYPDANSEHSAVEAAIANEVNDDIPDDDRICFLSSCFKEEKRNEKR